MLNLFSIDFLIKTGNREFVPLDFRWILERDVRQITHRKILSVLSDVATVIFMVIPCALLESMANNFRYSRFKTELKSVLARARDLHDEYVFIQKYDIGKINAQLEKIRLKGIKAQLEGRFTSALSEIAKTTKTRA